MVQIVRPYFPPRCGIRFRDKKTLRALQVTSVQTHIVNGQKKTPRLTTTVKLGDWDNQETFDEAFTKAYDEAQRVKKAQDVEVSSAGTALFNKSKVQKIGTFGQSLDDLWNTRYSKQTQSDNVKIYMNDVLNYFPKEKKLNSFTLEQMEAFKKHMRTIIENRTHCGSGTVSPSSINKRMGIIREVWRHAIKHRWMNQDDLPNPDSRVKNMGCEDLSRNAPKLKPVLDVQQESQLIQLARDCEDWDYADALVFLFDVGLRHDGEVNVITIDNVDIRKGLLEFQRRKTGGNWSVIPLTSRAIEVAKRRTKFALSNGGRMWTYSKAMLRHRWDKYKKLAQLPKKYTSYCTRHTCATRLVEKGLPPNVVKDWMGHKSILTTLTYYARSTIKLLNQAKSALEDYNQECEATVGDTKNDNPMLGHNSKNRLSK